MFKKLKYRIRLLSLLMPFSNGVKRFFVLNIILSIVAMGLAFLSPLFYKLFIDEVILNRKFGEIVIVISGYLGVFFLTAIIGYIKNYSNNRLINRTTFRTKLKIWRGFFKLNFSEYETRAIGDMKMRLEDDTSHIAAFAQKQTIDYLVYIIIIIISSILLVLIDWRLAIFAFVSIPLTFWLNDITSKKERYYLGFLMETMQNLSSWLHTSIQNWREVKALNLEKNQKRKLIKFIHDFAVFNAKGLNWQVSRVFVIPKIKDMFFMRFGLYFFGGLLIINGHMKIGELLVFAIYYEMLSNAVGEVSSADAEMQVAMPYTDRMITELTRFDNKKTIMENRPSLNNVLSIIEFKDVCFSYAEGEKSIIDKLNLAIKKGERVAITGKSGSGKTTILKLITGMIVPSSGKVLFSGIDLNELEISKVHKKIGFVMQENILFNTSIKENLLYGKYGATEDELIEACKKAFILEFIKSLPEGFETIIGEKGIKLSGGQRQRLVLSRLFLRDVDVFIFDEATSALDQYSESIVHDAINSIAKDKTVIVVAHRKSSIDLCDRVIEI